MHNTYINSNLLSLMPRGSLSFSFNDYSSLLNQGFERNPCSSHCCSCCCSSCCCCSSSCSSSFNVQRVPIYPSLLYGLRQSTLIQCAPSRRRLILGGRNRVYYQIPAYGLNQECYEVACSFKEKGGSEKVERRRGRERFKSVNSSRTRCLSGIGDFEAVISLLSEKVSEEYIGSFDRSGIGSKRVEIEERGSYGSECRKGRKTNVNVKLGSLGSGCKTEFKFARVESRKGECSRKEDREAREETKALSRRENRNGMAASSSFSSNYSLDSTGDFESDMEAREEHGDVLEESCSGYKKRLRHREDRLDEQVVEEQKEHSARAERKAEVLGHGTIETRTSIEWDLRKKSEKNFTEIEENISRKESSQVHSRMASTHESDYRKALSSHSQIDDKEEKTLAVNVEEGAKKQYSHSGSQVQKKSEFRRTYQGVTDMEEIQGTNVETAPQRQKQFIGRKDKLILDADLGSERREDRHKIVHGSPGEGNLQRNTQKFIDVTDTGNINTNITSNLQRYSESRMKVHEEDRVLSSLQETSVQPRHQVGEQVTELTKARSLQRVPEALGIEESNIKRTTVLQEGTRMKNLVGSTSAIYGSGAEAKEQGTQTDQKALQDFQYRQGSQDVKNLALNVTNISLVHSSNTETVNISHETSEKSMVEQGSESASFTKPILERKDKNDQTDENAALVKSKKEAHLASKTSSFREETSPSSQTYLSTSSLDDVQQSDAGEGNLRSPQEMMKPPSPQLITIGSMHVDQATGISIEMIDTEPSESSPSAFYTNSGGRTPASHQQTYGSDREGELYGEPLDLPVHEDTLGSAHRLEVSSTQFVGEFIEKARHGLSTSGIQKETTVSDTKLASKSENEGPKSSGHGSGKVQMHVDQATGISIEMIDTEPSESSPSAFYTNSGGRTPASHQQTCGSDREGELYGEPLDLPVHEDTLGSAHRLEVSSTQFVGEFIEKARHGLSTSGIQKETTVSDTKLASKSENEGPKSSGHGSGKVQMKDQDSRKSSGGSGAKGPSDEMWHVMDPSVQEPPETEAPEDRIEPEDIVVKRTGKSLWGVIGKIFRLRWGSLGESPTSTRRSEGKSSSHDSVSSEAWFSGHEHDETSDETVKRGKMSMQKEAVTSPQLQQMKMSSQGRSETFDTTESEDIIRKLEADTLSASQIMRSGSTSKAISSPSEGKNFGWSQGGSSSQLVNSGVEAGEPLPSSHAVTVEENSGADKADVSLSGSTEREQPLTANLTEGSVSDGKDVVLRQRRLQRNKQVVRDKFDEWEEAHIHESEQRKVDEMYMREALLEAKKAADSWEVPVGAVLVQHGKIIARGCNLVEELRDSTAHAEMICIREASNQLRSWRLSDTTLYVTLEPCPMCAGAILQARVDTVVWGAPNKLLGADGSWIRLFPNDGGNDPEVADKPPPPVHPFHTNMKIRRGILASECADAMQQFFQLRRRKKKVEAPPSPPQPSCLPIPNPQPKILSKMHDIFHIMFCL